MKRVVIMSGVSGSGKSTYAEKLLTDTQGIRVSADHFFMVDGEYRFDPSKLQAAHTDCFGRFLHYCSNEWKCVVVDNTNTTECEIAPYILGALVYGYQPEVITIQCRNENDIKVAAARNSHHVPLSTVMSQYNRLISRRLPHYWKYTFIDMQG